MQRDVATVRDFLARVRRRLTILSAAHGMAGGLALSFLLAVLGWPGGRVTTPLVVGAAAALLGSIVSVSITARRRRGVATEVERRAPDSRNLILTAAELSTAPRDEYASVLVFDAAARLVARLNPTTLFPARRTLLVLSAASIAWLLAVARPVMSVPSVPRGTAATSTSLPNIDGIDVTVEPPTYTSRPKQILHDPARIEALAGSKLSLSVRAHAAQVGIETLSSRDTLTKHGSIFAGAVEADADGFIALQPANVGHVGPRRLIGLTVLPDVVPRVKIVTPGRDQRFPDGQRTLEIVIEASDDLALASLTLRFTKVSGSGERYTFVEGHVPISITRRDERTWVARATWNLGTLELGPGDMVVYRAVASDKRASGGTAESDSYIAEILAPGGVAAPGFEVDPEQERYAVSQQMVIVKTERLIARRAAMSAEAFADESQQLAAEQRKVRAEFVFMLGGELADAPDLAESMTEINEEEEAQREDDILAGRQANAGHVALLRAIRAMSRAAASLTAAEPTTALPHERRALNELERAFSHTRILLRALSTRERLDLSRRLTGSLSDAVGDARPAAEPLASSTAVALRRALSDIATLASSSEVGAGAATRVSTVAERVLRVDPSSRTLQDVAAQLAAAASALSSGRTDNARTALDRASAGVVIVLRRELPSAPIQASDIAGRRTAGALIDALRAGRVK